MCLACQRFEPVTSACEYRESCLSSHAADHLVSNADKIVGADENIKIRIYGTKGAFIALENVWKPQEIKFSTKLLSQIYQLLHTESYSVQEYINECLWCISGFFVCDYSYF